MNAEKSILVEKTPTSSRRKITKTNAQVEGSRTPHTRSHSTGKHVTITTSGLDIPKVQKQDIISSSQWDIPSPDYLDESPTQQIPQKIKVIYFIEKILILQLIFYMKLFLFLCKYSNG